MSYQDFLSNNPLVIDNGTGVIKAGLAGTENPSCIVRTCVGQPKYDRVSGNAQVPDSDLWMGNVLNSHRGLCHLEYPIRHGIVEDWDMMEKLWQHLYDKSQLGIRSREHPVLLSQPAISPTKQSEKMAEIFLEGFSAPAISIIPQSLLSMYSTGRETGLVVDIGEGVSTYFPVCEGFALTPKIRRVDLGGREVTSYLQLLLRRSGYIFSTTSEFEVVRELKEEQSVCSTADTVKSLSETLVGAKLPDGQIIHLKGEQAKCNEVLFNPSLIGYDVPGVSSLISQTIHSCDLDLRSELYSNIILSGGVTKTTNFGNRVMEELRTISPPNTRVRMFAPSNREVSAWHGGSVLSTISSFKNVWVTKDEYKEQGIRCLYSKLLIYSCLMKKR